MRIAHVVRTLSPNAGGLPVVPVRLAAAQSALGHRVGVVAQRDAAADADPPVLFSGVPGADRVERRWAPPVGAAALLGAGRRAMTDVLADADVIHLHGLWDPVTWTAAAVAHRLSRPYVVAPHGMLDPWSLSQKRWKKKLALALGWRRALNDAAAIHVLNVDEDRLLAGLGLTAPRVVIPNGVFLDEVGKGRPGAFREAHPAVAGDGYVLFLSRLHFKKGLDYLADAFAEVARRVPSLRLVVAGPDDGERGSFETRLTTLGIGPRVSVIGPIAGQEKWDLIAGAACFCLPSRQEGFSMAVLEALACGVPVVVSEECHFPEVAVVSAGFVVPLDSAAIADALVLVTGNRDLRSRMGVAGRQLVADRFTWGRAAEVSVGVYERAIRR